MIIKFNKVQLNIGLLSICLLFFVTNISGQKMESHVIFNKGMKKSSFKKMINAASEADVIFFGELHNDPIGHWLEFELVKAMHENGGATVGFEMFERDNQVSLEKYVAGQLEKKEFEEQTRLWNNYKTDYAPVVEYAKEHKITCVATNVPRKYASAVYQAGFEALNELSEEEKAFLAPLPIPYDANLPSYVKMLDMMGGHGGENLPKAQAIKDATMAYSISQSLEAGKTYVHLNGSYHSDDYEGIIWYLNQYIPDLKILTITTKTEGEESAKELKGKADFIVLVNKNMTKTY